MQEGVRGIYRILGKISRERMYRKKKQKNGCHLGRFKKLRNKVMKRMREGKIEKRKNCVTFYLTLFKTNESVNWTQK